jgi:glycosyltransferase involved in cell wall biosynthesis
MSKIFLSVVIATYNRQQYLRSAIQSVLRQTYPYFELIIIDDGSTDETAEIVHSFKDSRIQYFWKKHTRCWDTKNNGVIKSNGDYIVFLDSDDFFSQDYFNVGIQSIVNNPGYEYYYPERLNIVHPDGSSTNSSWRYMDVPIKDRWKLIHIFLREAIAGIPHPGSFIKKNTFDKCGLFDDNLFNFGDSAYIVKNALKIRFKMIPHLRYYYNRQHPDQTNKSFLYRAQTIADLMEYIINTYPIHFHIPGSEMIVNEIDRNKILNQYYIDKFIQQSKLYPNHKAPFLIYAKKYIQKLRDLNQEFQPKIQTDKFLEIKESGISLS